MAEEQFGSTFKLVGCMKKELTWVQFKHWHFSITFFFRRPIVKSPNRSPGQKLTQCCIPTSKKIEPFFQHRALETSTTRASWRPPRLATWPRWRRPLNEEQASNAETKRTPLLSMLPPITDTIRSVSKLDTREETKQCRSVNLLLTVYFGFSSTFTARTHPQSLRQETSDRLQGP